MDEHARTTAISADARIRDHYGQQYDSFADEVYGAIRGEACGEDFGQNSWHTGNVLSVDAVRAKFAVLDEHCARLGRPYESVLRTYWSPPVVLAETHRGLRQKVDTISAVEQQFYGEHMVLGTPEEVIPHYQRLVDAGMQYFIFHTRADPDTARLLAEQVLPALTPTSSPFIPPQ